VKAPAFQFYTGDWLKDPQLSMCSPATRGVWMDLLCAMHELGRSGQVTGTVEQLCRLCRCTTAEMRAALAELDSAKTAQISDRNGVVTVICRRMQREHRERTLTNARVRKHRHGEEQETVKRSGNVTSSSSSSSSSANNSHAHSAGAREGPMLQRGGSPGEPIVPSSESPPEEMPPDLSQWSLRTHWDIYHVGIDLDTQARVVAAVTDKDLWREALQFWVDNDYRGRSIGKIVKKYRELEAERGQQRGKETHAVGRGGGDRPSANARSERQDDAAECPHHRRRRPGRPSARSTRRR
jgi:hypothetical protein